MNARSATQGARRSCSAAARPAAVVVAGGVTDDETPVRATGGATADGGASVDPAAGAVVGLLVGATGEVATTLTVTDAVLLGASASVTVAVTV